MTDKVQQLRQAYGWLKGFIEAIPENTGAVSVAFKNDYERIHHAIARALELPLGDFASSTLHVNSDEYSEPWVYRAELNSKAMQLLSFLEYGYGIEEKKLEVESLFKAIHDRELQERCADLIVGSGPFDRVINQATLVLEERLRNRAGLDRNLHGVGLVSAAVKNDPDASLIIFSNIRSEQEGYASIIRGLMLALRNETHHTTSSEFSREDALSICGFIDRILRLIEKSVVKRQVA